MKKNKGITLIALVITIIILLILAGISITSLIGQNGILTRANNAKIENKRAEAEEQIKLAVMASYNDEGKFEVNTFKEEIKKINATIVSEDKNNILVEKDEYITTIDIETGKIINIEIDKTEITPPELWKITNATDQEWYDYGNAKINTPKLTGKMKAIKYVGEMQTGNKWANAVTADGSMWVWIPRYAYKITKGYHSNTTGTIEVAFLDTKNNFLNGESGTLLTDPSKVTYTNKIQNEWLVHPAFTSNAEYGGGFGELEGLWVGKFEATGSKTELSVKPGEESIRNMIINELYKLAKISTFGETVALNSHMAKNSEWGTMTYLTHSKYGTNAKKVERSTVSNYYTGGSNKKEIIYTTNKMQSTTHNATGIYDLNSGAYEYVASYSNNGSSYLSSSGGTQEGDLYGATKLERATSTPYKMVYEGTGTIEKDYETAKKYKGDAVYETSNSYESASGSWFASYAYFPYSSYPFCGRGGGYINNYDSIFYFAWSDACGNERCSFRPVLAF